MIKSKSRNMAFLQANNESIPAAMPSKLPVAKAIEMILADGERRWKPSMIIFYTQRLAVVSAVVAANGIQHIDELKPKFARQMRELRLSQVSGLTVHHDEVALKMLTRWCAANEYIDRDPLVSHKALPMAQARPKSRRPAQRWEMDKVVTAIEHSHRLETEQSSTYKRAGEYRYVKARDRMIVLTMIEMAGHSGEVISLTKGDLHRGEGYIHINKSGMADTRKNKEDLFAPVSAAWWSELDSYLQGQPEIGDDDLLFPLKGGNQMNSGQWAHRFRAYCKAGGLDGLVSHCIRHAGATQEREINGDLAALRKIGDSSMQSLERYTLQAGKGLDLRCEQHARVAPLATFLADTGRAPKASKRVAYKYYACQRRPGLTLPLAHLPGAQAAVVGPGRR